MKYYLEAWRKYAQFSGRARRPEYWYFVLFNFLITFGLGIIDGILPFTSEGSGLGILGGLYSLAVLIPSLAVTIRRLHDTGRSGWWVLISLIPLIGFIILIVFLCSPSIHQENSYSDSSQ
jgi:uncharacterized membrane protein YhaH (DUF805 family)